MVGQAWQEELEAGKSHFTCTQGAEREKLGSGVRLSIFLKLHASFSKTPPPKGPITFSSNVTGEVGTKWSNAFGGISHSNYHSTLLSCVQHRAHDPCL